MTHLWHTRVAAAFVLVVAPLAAGAPGDARADEALDAARFEAVLGAAMEDGLVVDAVVAKSRAVPEARTEPETTARRRHPALSLLVP